MVQSGPIGHVLADHRDRYQAMLRRLREARLDAGMTQEQTAAALGKPQSFVSKIETGERRIDPIELQTLARLYQAELHTFFT